MRPTARFLLFVFSLVAALGCTRISSRNGANTQDTQVDGRGWGGNDPVLVAFQTNAALAKKAIDYLSADGDPDQALCQHLNFALDSAGTSNLYSHYLNAAAFSQHDGIFQNWTLTLNAQGSAWAHGSSVAYADSASKTLTFNRDTVASLTTVAQLTLIFQETLRIAGLTEVGLSGRPEGSDDFNVVGQCESAYEQLETGAVSFGPSAPPVMTGVPRWIGLGGEACGFGSGAGGMTVAGATSLTCQADVGKLHNILLKLNSTSFIGSLIVRFRVQTSGERYELALSPAAGTLRYVDASGQATVLGVLSTGWQNLYVSMTLGQLVIGSGVNELLRLTDTHIDHAGNLQVQLDPGATLNQFDVYR